MPGIADCGNGLMQRVTEVITANLNNDQFGETELAREMGMSRLYIHRQLKKLNDLTISHFIRNVCLDKAMVMLKGSDKSASEAACKTALPDSVLPPNADWINQHRKLILSHSAVFLSLFLLSEVYFDFKAASVSEKKLPARASRLWGCLSKT